MTVIEQMLERYPRHTDAQETHALREVMQEIALAGLGRGGFFAKAAFYGGTCLRIFHGLQRFSEDLDFSLLKPDSSFSFAPYLQTLREEFSAFGFEVQIEEKQKTAASDIVSAFLKKTSSRYDLNVSGRKALKIKFEVDTDPPLGFATEERLLIQPYSFYVKCFALPDLFAGKMHALLFRQWKNRVKGRDWYDFEWYVRRGTPLNLAHLSERSRQSGHWSGGDMNKEQFMEILHKRTESVDFVSARQDVEHFVGDPEQLAIWSREYFHQLAQLIRVNS
ncbi:Nucleotidyl transferase AbiEii toxin, Type IV TA system [anaerobic digester metagenome]